LHADYQTTAGNLMDNHNLKRLENMGYLLQNIAGYFVTVRHSEWKEPSQWLPVYETQDYETAEMLWDELDLRWGNVGPYRHFDIRALRDPVVVLAARSEIDVYRKVLEVATEYERSFPDAAWIVERMASDETSRLAEQYAYCVEVLKSLEDDAAGSSSALVIPKDQNKLRGNGNGKDAELPAKSTDEKVAEYLKKHKKEHQDLVQQCLNRVSGASRKFQDMFGPTAIARAVGMEGKKQSVHKCPTYKLQIRPVMETPPRPPRGWKPPEVINKKFGPIFDRMKNLASPSE